MKTTLRLVTIGLPLLATLTAGAFFDPTIGRWASRDPIGERGGQNSHAFARNSPAAHTDTLGLFTTTLHPVLTKAALGQMSVDLAGPLGIVCMQKVENYIAKWSFNQDLWHSGDDRRHFVRVLIEGETETERAARRSAALVDYSGYVAAEQTEFYQALNPQPILLWPRKPKCKQALQSLGYLAHSWEDFYGHGIHQASGWTTFGPFMDSPDMPLDTWPSSWRAFGGGEHPGWGLEPPFGTDESNLRRDAAVRYVAFRFSTLLRDWLGKCACSCADIPE